MFGQNSRRKMFRQAFFLLAMVASQGVSAAEGEGGLLVAAAASLSNALPEIAQQFARDCHCVEAAQMRFSFAASGTLVQQMVQGAPVDLFISADTESMALAQKKGVAAESLTFARNMLVLIRPKGRNTVTELASLKKLPDGARITLGNPAFVPAGRYAREVLQADGLWMPLESRMVLAQNVRQALDYVARGEVEAGFVYASDAALLADKVVVAQELRHAPPVLYPAALALPGTGKQALANRFLRYLREAPAQAVLQKYGFSPLSAQDR